MSNGNVPDDLSELFATAKKLVLDGERDEEVLRSLIESFIEQKPKEVWRVLGTIKLGNGLKTIDDFCDVTMSLGMRIGDWANDVLSKSTITFSDNEADVELVVASVAELGFKDGATLEEIYVRAQEFKGDLCPIELALQLRIQYTDQPKGEMLIIATEPIKSTDGLLHLLIVAHIDGVRCLGADHGYPGYSFNGNDIFGFIRRKLNKPQISRS